MDKKEANPFGEFLAGQQGDSAQDSPQQTSEGLHTIDLQDIQGDGLSYHWVATPLGQSLGSVPTPLGQSLGSVPQYHPQDLQHTQIYYQQAGTTVSTVSQPLTITTVTPGGNMGSQDLVLTPGGTLSTHGIMAHGGTIGLLPQASLNQPVADAFQQNIETPPAQADPGLFTTPTDSNVGLVTTHLTGGTGQHVLSTQQAASQQNIQDLITGTLGEKQNYLIVTGQTLQDRTAQSVHSINQHNQSSQSVQIHLPTGIQNQQPGEQIINQEQSVVKDNDTIKHTQPSVALQSEQNIVEEADVEKTAEAADEATGLAIENKKKTAGQPIKIFSQIKATISAELIAALSVTMDTCLGQLQSDFHCSVAEQDGEYTLMADLQELVKVQKKLSLLAGGESDVPVTKDRGVMCEMLKPAEVTRSGRVVKPRMRPSLSDDSDVNDGNDAGDEDYKVDEESDEEEAPVVKTKSPVKSGVQRRKGRPRKLLIQTDSLARKTTRKQKKKSVKDSPFKDSESTKENINEEDQEDVSDDDNDDDGMEKTEIHEFPVLSQAESDDQEQDGTKKAKKDYEKLAPFKFFCKLCSFKTKRKSHFMRHKDLHKSNPVLLNCSKCSFTTIRLGHLRRHEVAHSSDVKTCPKCGKYKTSNARLLEKHIRLKHDVQPKMSNKITFNCSVEGCSYETSRKSSFERHLRCHVDLADSSKIVNIYQCDKCSYSTPRKEHYLRHNINVHTNVRPFLCDLCGQKFKRADALRQHRQVHVDVENRFYSHKCEICKKSFRSQAHLNEHKAMHSSVRNYLCDICGAAFKTKSVQKKHIRTIHSNPRAHACDECSKRFNTKYGLMRHKRTHTEAKADGIVQSTDGQLPGTTQVFVRDVQEVHIAQDGTLVPVSMAGATPMIEVAYGTDPNTDVRQIHHYQIQNEGTTALLYLTKDIQSNY